MQRKKRFKIKRFVSFLFVLAGRFMLRLRRSIRDRRIIKLAKGVGAWDTPSVLCGRALELKAWEDFKIKRQKGETDEELRRRYVEEGRKKFLPKDKGESSNE